MRDFLAAIRERVVVFDGGMGATLEQFDLSLEDDYAGCRASATRRSSSTAPTSSRACTRRWSRPAPRSSRPTPSRPRRLKLEEWGLGEHTLEINRSAAEIARKAVGEDRFVAGSIGPTGYLPASDDPTLGADHLPRARRDLRPSRPQGLVEGGADLLIIETAQDILEVKAAVFGAREAFKATGRAVPIQTSRLAAAQRRQDAARHRHRRRARDARGAAASTSSA